MTAIRVLPLVLLVPTSGFAAEADDLKKLTGVWKGWVVEGRGDDPKQRRWQVELTIDGNKVTGLEDGRKDLGAGTITIRHTRDGKQLDATRTKGSASRAGSTYLGLYTLEGNTLRWCVGNPPGQARPTELRSKTGQFRMVLTKAK
jgi:uncharacterized protein (TIGR03067 family)